MNKCLTFIFVSVLSVDGGINTSTVLFITSTISVIIVLLTGVDEVGPVVGLTNVIGAITDKRNWNINQTQVNDYETYRHFQLPENLLTLFFRLTPLYIFLMLSQWGFDLARKFMWTKTIFK